MAFPLSVFLAQVDGLLASDGATLVDISTLVRYRQIKQAIERYSTDRPDEYTEDVTGNASKYYALNGATPALTKFTDYFSRVIQVEYPAQLIASGYYPVYLEPESWNDAYYTTGNVRYLFLPGHQPGLTELLRVRYTIPYQWVASGVTSAVSQTAHGFIVGDYVYQDTTWIEAPDQRIATHIITVQPNADTATAALLQTSIPVSDFFAVCNLAAGLCCQAIADKYSRTSDSGINADSVGYHVTRAGEFSRRAKELIALYEGHLGIGAAAERYKAAGEFVDLDTAPGWPGHRDYLFHGGGTR